MHFQRSLDITPNWISLDAGLTSMIRKYAPEDNDIVRLLKEHYKLVNPFDTRDLLHHRLSETPSYLRICAGVIPHKLAHYTLDQGFMYATDSRETPAHYTLISDPTTLDKVARVDHMLQDYGL